MWLQAEEVEENKDRSESPTGGKSYGTIAELADLVGVELLETEVGDDVDEKMEDDFPPVQGIPNAFWEGLKALKGSKHAPGKEVRGDKGAPTLEKGKRNEYDRSELYEGITDGDLRRLGLSGNRKAGDIMEDILSNGRKMMELQTM